MLKSGHELISTFTYATILLMMLIRVSTGALLTVLVFCFPAMLGVLVLAIVTKKR